MRSHWRLIQLSAVLQKRLLICCGILLMTVHVSAEQLSKAIFEKMASEEFKVREEGQRELREWAKKNTKTAPEILHDAWKQKVDPELKSRCFDVMRETVLLRRFGPGPGFVGIGWRYHCRDRPSGP